VLIKCGVALQEVKVKEIYFEATPTMLVYIIGHGRITCLAPEDV
jgi:hypothetical protein